MDISNIIDMSNLFVNITEIKGSISNWDVSHVRDMSCMFSHSKLNEDISSWNVSSVTDMAHMFAYSPFDQDISKWNISSVSDMSLMFFNSQFSQNLGAWNLDNKKIIDIFKTSKYSFGQYVEDREEYLNNFKLEKNKKDNEKYLEDEKNRVNNELNKNIELDTIELEF